MFYMINATLGQLKIIINKLKEQLTPPRKLK
jgi:hypothetical protein